MNIFLIICLLLPSIHGSDLTPIVKLTNGPIRGKVTSFKYVKEGEYKSINVYQFLGIPYAKPPIGKLRLQLPVEPDSWTDVKKVTDYGSACLQPTNLLDPFKKTNEDCLFINVQVTELTFNNSTGQLRPVLVWIHGGGFKAGSGNSDTVETPLVPLHDVILVTINYRLGPFGFIYFGPEQKIPPNIGLHDQLLALKWIKANIQKFGGDPDRITIFGESAGSISVSAHVISPLSKGLFKRAIFQSGTVYFDHHTDTLISDSWKLYNETSCSESTNVLECMQSLPANKILSNMPNKTVPFSFIVGDEVLPHEPEKVFSEGLFDSSVDLLLGAEKNDGSLFMNWIDAETFNYFLPLPVSYQTALNFIERCFDEKSVDYFRELYGISEKDNSIHLREALENLFTDFVFACPTYMFGYQYASSLGKKGGKVFAYYHTQRPSGYRSDLPKWLGTFHGSDIPYVFGLPLIKSGYSQKDITLSREMMKIWTHFAENGEPPKVGGTEWKSLNEDKIAMVLNIDDLGKTESERIEFCVKEWSHFLPHVNKIKQQS